MNKTVELLDRIRELERENKLLSDKNTLLAHTIEELQQQNQQVKSPFQVPVASFPSTPLDYTASDFWLQPADSLWNPPKRKVRRNNPRFKYMEENFPWLSTDGDFTLGKELFAAEDSPNREDENAELRKKVSELKKKIEKLESKLEELNSPLVYVVNAIKDKARYDSPSAAYELFEQMDYIFRDCNQWKENVQELKDFLLREKYRALQPPLPSANYPTDKQLADAISNICGKNKPLNEYQNWLGVCCYVSARCGYPTNLKLCCERLKELSYRSTLYREVKYENIRAYSNWNFVKAGYDQWSTFKANDQERSLFTKCRDTAMALDKALTDADR